jgi:hypothetical protein
MLPIVIATILVAGCGASRSHTLSELPAAWTLQGTAESGRALIVDWLGVDCGVGDASGTARVNPRTVVVHVLQLAALPTPGTDESCAADQTAGQLRLSLRIPVNGRTITGERRVISAGYWSRVPSVIGLSRRQARQLLVAGRLRVHVAGTGRREIVSETPAPGTRAPHRTVTLRAG